LSFIFNISVKQFQIPQNITKIVTLCQQFAHFPTNDQFSAGLDEFSAGLDEFSANCKISGEIPGGAAARTDFNGIYIGWVETLAGCCPAH
jgi:hypothetical protein